MDQHTNVDVLQLRSEENEVNLQQSQDHEVELCQTLRLQVEDLQKRLEEKDNKLTQANKVIRALRDEVQTLQQQLEQHRRKYRDDIIGQRDQQCQCGRGNDITLGRGDQPNAFLSCTTEDDPEDVPMSPQEVEDDAADVPTSPGDDTLTSSAGVEDDPADIPLILGDGTLIRVKSLRRLKRPVRSVKLQDRREMLRPDRVIKMESEEGDEDNDDEDNGNDPCYQDNDDDSDYDPKRDGFYFRSENKEVLFPPEEGIVEPEGEQRMQSRGGKRLSTDSPHENASIASPDNGNDQTVDNISMQSGGLLQHQTLGKHPPGRLLPGKPGRSMKETFLSPKVVQTEKTNIGSCQEVDQSSTQSSRLIQHPTDDPHENTSPTDSPHENASTVSPNTRSDRDAGKTSTSSSDLQIQSALPLGKPGRLIKGTEKRKDYVCNVCGKKLAHATGLRNHLKIHSGEKPHACAQCGKTFIKKENLHAHEKCHSEDRPYACTQCDKMFKTKGVLLIHERIHSGEKPFTCTKCEKTFRVLTNLKAHQKTQHPEPTDVDIEREKFPCDVCGKVLASGPNLVLHKRLHTGAGTQCDMCGMLISKQSNLLKHMRIHTGERPYSCTVCEKTFICTGTLNIHHRRHHSTETPYKCPNCPMEFKITKDLKRHVTQKHSGEKAFSCPLCSKTFHTTHELKSHKKGHLGSDVGRGDNSHAVHL
ncbi:zinc finger protein 271-like [Engraulis encrasicolus]|uniref:zinc finger protein 271-like n=1 Tax=Engraulis encrasicolus TaxID=184585 RepID=UPI002FD643DD